MKTPRKQAQKASPKPRGKSPIPSKSLFPMRINKYLALKNYATRKGGDEMVAKKQVFINGRLAVLGDKVNEDDHIEVRTRGRAKNYLYFAYNKPIGIITHSAQKGEVDIEQELRKIPELRSVFPVGRLDKNSHGLLILTNDGRITDKLLNPDYEHDKEYVVRTTQKLRDSFKTNMEGGLDIEGYKTKPCKVKIINEHTFQITLTEGKKHQIRRMVSALHNEVSDLERTRILNIRLGNMPQGNFRKIEDEELAEFLSLLNFQA